MGFQQRTVQAIIDWAAPGDLAAAQHRRIALAYYGDRLQKSREITALECRAAAESEPFGESHARL